MTPFIEFEKDRNSRRPRGIDNFSAHQGVEDDDMNVICLGGRITGSHLAREIAGTFLTAAFSSEERHNRRLLKVASLEK